ncbi:MAG TPA: nitroreductase [Ruminococcaceae bacterium]|nr:nitroreductase [Oscillospiraceae bacterium]
MEFTEVLKSRYSVRKFSDRKIEKEKLDKILEAGRTAPTAVDYQPQRILVLDSEENLTKLKDCTPYHFNAPLALLVCYDNTASWKRPFDGKDMGEVDASVVATHMMLEVTDLGLGSTWVGHFDAEKAKKLYQLPENIIPVMLLPIGYPREDARPSVLHLKRLDLDKTVFYNSFDGVNQK